MHGGGGLHGVVMRMGWWCTWEVMVYMMQVSGNCQIYVNWLEVCIIMVPENIVVSPTGHLPAGLSSMR